MAKKKTSKKTTQLKTYEPATVSQIAGFSEEILNDWGYLAAHGIDIRDDDLASISTGSTKLDWALGRPFVEGSINEIHGANGTGKTTISLEVAASATKMGKPVYFFDLEHKLTESQINMISGLDKSLFWRIQPSTGEDAVNKVLKCISEVPGCVIIFDSITQLLPEVEDAEGAENMQRATVARLAAKMVRKITGTVKRNRCMVLFISHITTNMDPYASGDTVKGGKAVPDISAQRVKLKRLAANLIKDKTTNDIIGQQTQCIVIKNNQSIPFKKVDVPIIYGSGIARALDLLQFAREICIIDYPAKSGWYHYVEIADMDMDEPPFVRKRESEMIEIIRANKAYRDELVRRIRVCV